MKYQIIWPEFAEQQLDEIFEYYSVKAGVKVATAIVRSIILKPDGLTGRKTHKNC